MKDEFAPAVVLIGMEVVPFVTAEVTGVNVGAAIGACT